jgi:hypothetical protein
VPRSDNSSTETFDPAQTLASATIRITCSKLTIPCTRNRDSIFSAMIKKEHSPKEALTVRCPTCGAKPGEKCELSTGLPRTDPHRDRRLIAKD